MKRISLFFVIVFICFSSFAQRFTSFSQDPLLTVVEMKEFSQTVPKEKAKESEQLLRDFMRFWESEVMDDQLQRSFIEISNMMLRKNMRMLPHFEAYIRAFAAFAESDYADNQREWLQILQYHVNNDASTFHLEMENYINIFNYGILYKSANSRWTAYGGIDKMGVKEEPFFVFSNIRLVGSSRQDSLEIFSTNGTYFPASERFRGEGGTVYWTRAGLTEDVKATLSQYEIDARSPKITAEKVLFYYPDYFAQPLTGRLEEKAGLETSEEKAKYPRFTSYEKLLAIKNIYKNVDYVGGFEMRGASIMGSSHNDTLAKIYITKKDKRIIAVQAQNYMFKKESVLANDARVVIYMEEDSIYHPAADFRYNEISGELLISRNKNGIGRSPFFDSYHKMDIYAETMSWVVTEERIEFKNLPGQTSSSPAIFESQNFFEGSKMRRLQGYNETNPLFDIWTVFRANDYQNVPVEMFVNYFGKSPEDVKRLLIEYAAEGFIEYDLNNGKIGYRRKIAQYLNNDVGKRDYDNLRLESKNHYASIDLLNNDLRVSGCEFFVLSDAQIVNVYPANEQVTVKKNRDLVFSGRVIAGLFDFVSHNCEFSYDKFSVTMNVIDSMIMYVEDKTKPTNMYGEYKLEKVRSSIQDLSGTLYIDLPENKSGRVDVPDYPMFESRTGGKVYYDQYAVLQGAYKRDRFYYLVDVFTIKNLDNFATDSIQYNGRLVSGGIFPDIVQELKVRPDFSLGFVHQTSKSGIPAYNEGVYEGIVDLSNRGLRGKGTLSYLTSITQSDSLVFYLDAVQGSANTHIVKEQLVGTEYPPAIVNDAYLDWKPYKHEMFVHTQKSPMTIFNETKLKGFSKLTPSGMFGSGTLTLSSADITSKEFLFKHHELLSDAANLKIYSFDNKEVVFQTDNYRSHIDFKTRKGHFISNGDVSEIFFVKNEFKTEASDFYWDPIDKDIIRMKWDDPYAGTDINKTPARELVDMTTTGNELIATHPEKKGLKFSALTASFNFSNNIIYAEGVRFINVGDAALIPYDGKVTIREKAEIEKLNYARLVAGRENKYHELYNVIATINSGADFRGSGDYDYIDENQTIQKIHFDTLWYYQETKGIAQIPMEANFKFSPEFGFNGRAELSSQYQFLNFVGGVELIHECDEVKYARMRINGRIDPNYILIEVSEKTKDVNDRKVVNAIASTNKEGRIYTCFGGAKDQFNDSEYISAFGYIMFDKASQEFRAASLEKLQNPSLPGNMIVLNKRDCISRGTGTIDMGAKLGRVDFVTNGTILNYMKADSAEMNLTTSIDFFFNDKAMGILSNALTASYSLDFFDYSNDDSYEMALINMMGEDEYLKYQKQVVMSGQVKKLPKKLQVQFLFSNIDFIWDKTNKAFVSQTLLPLIICGSKEINKVVPGRIVIEKRGSRNKLYIYFEFDDAFYFFQFENNSMYGYSSEKKFMDAIMAVDAKKRTVKSGEGQPSFTYKWGNRSQKNKFVKKFYNFVAEEGDEE